MANARTAAYHQHPQLRGGNFVETRGDDETPRVRRRSTATQRRQGRTVQIKVPAFTRPRALAVAGLIALGTGLTIAMVSSGSTVTIRGSLTLNFGAYIPDGTGGCTAASGYEDISAGTAVTIGDQTGATIAVGQLQAGGINLDGANGCVFHFDVQAPAGRQLYTVTVSHRGTQVFKPDQIHQANLTLGDTAAALGLG